ncbi:MAG: hypothetical protein JRI97_03610 [Deltaproteobacteria bacterium]|nr:hypothetical protein [Deltaproteobacteria bacterium]
MAEKEKKDLIKKCPYCTTPLKVEDKLCFSCKKRVGPPDARGVATVPGRWKSYVYLLLALGLVVAYFQFVFFR